MTKKIMIFPVIIIALLVVTTGCWSTSGSPSKSESSTPVPSVNVIGIGTLAPDFQLQNLDGEVVRLSTLRGSPVMFNFWATWCSSCAEEMPIIQEIYDEWSGKGLKLLAINLAENPGRVERFMENNNYSIPVLMDTRNALSRQYNILFTPTTFFVDGDGIIQAMKIGPFASKQEIESYLDTIMP